MKIGSIPVASVVLLVFAIASYIVKHFYPANYVHLAPYFDGALVGAMLVYLLYYANIYLHAWRNNRKEEAAK